MYPFKAPLPPSKGEPVNTLHKLTSSMERMVIGLSLAEESNRFSFHVVEEVEGNAPTNLEKISNLEVMDLATRSDIQVVFISLRTKQILDWALIEEYLNIVISDRIPGSQEARLNEVRCSIWLAASKRQNAEEHQRREAEVLASTPVVSTAGAAAKAAAQAVQKPVPEPKSVPVVKPKPEAPKFVVRQKVEEAPKAAPAPKAAQDNACCQGLQKAIEARELEIRELKAQIAAVQQALGIKVA